MNPSFTSLETPTNRAASPLTFRIALALSDQLPAGITDHLALEWVVTFGRNPQQAARLACMKTGFAVEHIVLAAAADCMQIPSRLRRVRSRGSNTRFASRPRRGAFVRFAPPCERDRSFQPDADVLRALPVCFLSLGESRFHLRSEARRAPFVSAPGGFVCSWGMLPAGGFECLLRERIGQIPGFPPCEVGPGEPTRVNLR